MFIILKIIKLKNTLTIKTINKKILISTKDLFKNIKIERRILRKIIIIIKIFNIITIKNLI